jgi:TetR/AcrR family transcriptional repressor of bet genes
MPKSIDHGKRRDDIALVACKVVAKHGFEQASVVRIARETGYTAGMIAHYFDSKQEIIVAALRLMLRRIEARLTQREGEPADLLAVLCEALPLDPERYMECAFWMVFVGQVSADKRLKRINAWVHREYQRLFKRCLASGWSEWADWSPKLRDQTLASVVTFINGLTASAVASRSDWPAQRQIEQLSLQLAFLRRHALEVSAASGKLGKKSREGAQPVVKLTETMP